LDILTNYLLNIVLFAINFRIILAKTYNEVFLTAL